MVAYYLLLLYVYVCCWIFLLLSNKKRSLLVGLFGSKWTLIKNKDNFKFKWILNCYLFYFILLFDVHLRWNVSWSAISRRFLEICGSTQIHLAAHLLAIPFCFVLLKFWISLTQLIIMRMAKAKIFFWKANRQNDSVLNLMWIQKQYDKVKVERFG